MIHLCLSLGFLSHFLSYTVSISPVLSSAHLVYPILSLYLYCESESKHTKTQRKHYSAIKNLSGTPICLWNPYFFFHDTDFCGLSSLYLVSALFPFCLLLQPYWIILPTHTISCLFYFWNILYFPTFIPIFTYWISVYLSDLNSVITFRWRLFCRTYLLAEMITSFLALTMASTCSSQKSLHIAHI